MKKIVNLLKTYIRKDNIDFWVEFFGSCLIFVISNISLILNNNFVQWKTWIPAIICAIFLVIIVVLIFRKYAYYHGLANQLQDSHKPLFLICAYIAKYRKRLKDRKINNITITEMDVIYDIDVPGVSTDDKDDCHHADLTVTYDVHAINGTQERTKIYHTSLSKNDKNIKAEYKFKNESMSDLEPDSYYNSDRNLQLWVATKSGNSINPRNSFSYLLQFNYKLGYNSMTDNRFLIHPANYAIHVNKINIIVRSKWKELGLLITAPQITSCYNGMNRNDICAQSKLEEKVVDGYETYYCLSVEPQSDSLYVLEILPKYIEKSKDKPQHIL